jgi:monovalent cation:proton antiporter-2 (CPA2) family protein
MSPLAQVAVFLLMAVLLVPLFRKAGLGAVLGYLVAGMLIGPFGIGIVGDVGATMQVAEFGVVLLLFLIGLELEPRRLWVLRRAVFGLGSAQVALTALVLAAAAIALGLEWRVALVAGFGLAMSSTALVLTSLSERGELTARYGRAAFAVLLFQDLAVIPLIALLPLLAVTGEGARVDPLAVAKGVAAIAIVIAASRVVVRPLLKAVANFGGREVFTAAALLLVVAAALLMEHFGLSMSLGAFLAGVLLADSEFRHELEADIEPFKGLLLGLFFIAVGMSANLQLLIGLPQVVIGIAAGVLGVKLAVMYGIARAARIPARDALRLAAALCQGGEFAFVLFALGADLGVLAVQTSQLLVLAVTLSMLAWPVLFALLERRIARSVENDAKPEFDTIDDPGKPVVIAGYGRVGQVVSRVLRMCGVPFTALELSFEQVDFVRTYGNKVYYGDASRLELLHAAKVGDAKLFVLAIDDVEASVRTAQIVRRHFPSLPIVARARNRSHHFRLRDLGVRMILRETFPSSLEMARFSLLRLGLTSAATERALALFRRHDEEMLDAQYAVRDDQVRMIETSKEGVRQLRELFESEASGVLAGWDSKSSTRA